ncbi:MAG: aspartate/glutamate racemase family protein [Theionarchaea archaeon]|nr:aspartate/glutamate racemase family protein [Theionarchaea archaeon]MBU7036489.1 aspartate/glutamate racemase family protein [Theionarchaea archaeon]
MYGWRCRIGLIIPSDNTVMESEFNKLFRDIPGVSVHATRVFLEELTVETLLQMKEGLKRACEELKSAEMDVLAYGCTSGSFVKGLHFDQEIIQEIEEETQITATTTSTAVIEALRKLKVNKIALGTPYSDEINEKAIHFFEGNNIEVTNSRGLNVVPDVDVGKQEPYIAYNLGIKVNTEDCDCVFLSCTDFRTVEIIDLLETRLKKPVISSNQATLWHCIALKNLGMTLPGYGTLLAG